MNGRGIESTPFYLILSAIILLLTALTVLPSYNSWQESMNLGKTAAEAGGILYAIKSVHSLGDIGSTQQIRLNLPAGYEIEFRDTDIAIKRENRTIKEYPADAKLRYRGSKPLSGPGTYYITIVHWTANDSTNKGKEYLLEVLDVM